MGGGGGTQVREGHCLFDWVENMGKGAGGMNFDNVRVSTLHAGRINIIPNI